MVERVEELKPKLHREAFANFVVLDERQIRVLISRGCERVATGVSQQRSHLTIDRHSRSGKGKAISVDVIVNISRIRQLAPGNDVRPLTQLSGRSIRLRLTTIGSARAGGIDVRLVGDQDDAERSTRLNPVNTSQLPSFYQSLDWLELEVVVGG